MEILFLFFVHVRAELKECSFRYFFLNSAFFTAISLCSCVYHNVGSDEAAVTAKKDVRSNDTEEMEMESIRKETDSSEMDPKKPETVFGGKANNLLDAFLMMTSEEREGFDKINGMHTAALAAWKADPTPENRQRMPDLGNEGNKYLELVKNAISEAGRCW